MDYWLYVLSLVSTSPKVVTVSFRGGRIPTYLFIHKRYYLTGQESIVLGQLFILSHWSNIPIYDDVSWQGRYYNRWSYPLSSGGQSNLPPKLPEFIEGLNGAIFPLVLPCLSVPWPSNTIFMLYQSHTLPRRSVSGANISIKLSKP